jgi:hypothetical protein
MKGRVLHCLFGGRAMPNDKNSVAAETPMLMWLCMLPAEQVISNAECAELESVPKEEKIWS